MNVCEHRARHVRTDGECEHLAGRGPRSITLDELISGREAGRRIAVSLFVRDTPLLSTTHTCRFKQVTAVQGHRARLTHHPQTRQLNAESASFVLKPGSRTGSFLCKECSFDVALKARPWAVGRGPPAWTRRPLPSPGDVRESFPELHCCASSESESGFHWLVRSPHYALRA